MAVKCFRVKSLGEYYNVIGEISDALCGQEGREIKSLWFRAESCIQYSLIPSLYRDRVEQSSASEKYTRLHYQEELRVQHYQAKNYHYFQNVPASRIEWLEVMQHHGVSTRVLDWSESSTHSLLFALEPFYSQKTNSFHVRYQLSPCVWVLDPNGLNADLIRLLRNASRLQEELLGELVMSPTEIDRVRERIANIYAEENMENEFGCKDTGHITFIANLSEMEKNIEKNRSRIKELLLDGTCNPMNYILARIYSDGFPIEDHKLPPLAVVQSYHSERIKAQKGVFAVFPFYFPNDKNSVWKNVGINPDSMSYNKTVQKHLYKICFESPQRMAREALENGMNESWLYPEMPIVSNEIEHHSVY